jgi:hypothetical protein
MGKYNFKGFQASFEFSDSIENPRKVRFALNVPLLSRESGGCEDQLSY